MATGRNKALSVTTTFVRAIEYREMLILEPGSALYGHWAADEVVSFLHLGLVEAKFL